MSVNESTTSKDVFDTAHSDYIDKSWNDTFDVHIWNEQYSRLVISNTIILTFFLFIGFCGNLIVIIIYSWRMKKNIADRYFIPILAVLDLLAICFSATFNLILNVRHYTFPGNITCKVFLYLIYVTTFSSLNMLLIIAVHRFRKVCHPLQKQMTLMWKKLATGICIGITSIFQGPILFFYGTVPSMHQIYNITGMECSKLKDVDTTQSLKRYQPFDIVLNSGLVVSITVIYIMIGRTIYKKTNLMKKRSTNQSGSSHNASKDTLHSTELDQTHYLKPIHFQKSNHQPCQHKISKTHEPEMSEEFVSIDSTTDNTTRKQLHFHIKKKMKGHLTVNRFSYMFMLISFLAFLSYLPPTVLISLESRNEHFWNNLGSTELQVLLFFRRLYMLNHIVNPLIYGLFDMSFRKEFLSLLCCKWKVQK